MTKKKEKQTSTLLFLLYTAIFLAGASIPSTAGGEADAAAMADLLKNLKNAPKNWKPGSDPCSAKWIGVSCSGGRITGINLRDSDLAGTLTSSLSSLTSLQSLFLSGNQISGPLPSLAGLTNLEEVSLDSNLFSSVPSDFFSDLASLQKISINDNPLSPWKLPDSFADCPITSFSASNASIFGSLPNFFDRISSLQILRLSYNNLSGILPPSLSRSQIREFFLNNQRGPMLSGQIDIIGQMSQISILWLQSNAFSGPIPDISNLSSLRSFNLRDNLLTGVVPNSLTKVSSLQNVSLSNNDLQGPMPKFGPAVSADIDKGNNFCLAEAKGCDSKVMQLLAVAAGFGYPALLAKSWSGNDPCGRGRGWFGVICDQEGNIVTLNFANQDLEGFIAPEIANISSLMKLILNNNSLTGVIPNSLTALHQLQLLDVSYNQLTGSVPSFGSGVRVVKSGNNFGSGSSLSGVAPGSYRPSSRGDQNGKSNKSSTEFVVGMVVAVLFLVGCLSGLVYYLGCKKQKFKRVRMVASPEHTKVIVMGFNGNNRVKSEFNTQSSDGGSSDTSLYRENSENLISIQDLWKATDNFSEDAILGRGGFGVVYKGVLSNGMVVAVKRCVLDILSMNGLTEFKAEIGLIGKAKHKHLVSLLGYCEHEKERLLVYEYMSEGTLAQHLFDSEGGKYCPLNWKQRLRIALDVAKAMEYLHSFMQGSFIHRDLKPSNILLDKDLRGKVSDFGLLKLAGDNEKSMATRLAGTFGYLAPEYAITGKITRKIDVYAFGVILLELMTSRKVLDDSVPAEDANLVAAFRRIHPRDLPSLERFVDSSLFPDEESHKTIIDVVEIAYHCTSRDPNYRPEMGNVVTMLSPIADRWLPRNYGDDDDDDGEYKIRLTSMVRRWQVSDDSSYTDSFGHL